MLFRPKITKLSFFLTIVLCVETVMLIVVLYGRIIRKAKNSTASEILSYMNESVDPCDDFYEFACGNWPTINPAMNVLTKLETIFNIKQMMLLKAKTETNDTADEKMVKHFYKSCVNNRYLKKNYNNSLKALISEFGEMPALIGDQWDETQFDWVDVVGRMAYKYQVSSFVSFDIYPDYTNHTVNRLYISQHKLFLKRKIMYLSNNTDPHSIRDVRRKKITQDLIKFLDLDEELAKKTANGIVQFEISLEEGMLNRHKKFINPFSPTIDIVRLVNLTMGRSISDPIYNFLSEYYMNLKKNLENTPKRTVANYVFYNLLTSFTQELQETSDEEGCMSITKEYFSIILDNMIYRRYKTNTSENEIKLMWRKMKTTFKKTLESNQMNWIRRKTRQYALQKLDAMKLEINLYSIENFAEKFGELVLTDNDFVKNLANIRELNAKHFRGRLYKMSNSTVRHESDSYSPTYFHAENRITVPVSMLQPYYLWSNGSPNAVKFGSLASVIGHELIHGFGGNGLKYGKDGNRKDWWDKLSVASFETRKQCFVNQYANYTYNSRRLNDDASQSENIADNGGLSLAYAAYLNWHAKADLSLKKLPSLNFTSKQLFFISYAQFWCNDKEPEERNRHTSTDPHAPEKFRVIGPLSNFPEFAKEFNCAAGKPMNPNNKCKTY